jgi:hypothetical protein
MSYNDSSYYLLSLGQTIEENNHLPEIFVELKHRYLKKDFIHHKSVVIDAKK